MIVPKIVCFDLEENKHAFLRIPPFSYSSYSLLLKIDSKGSPKANGVVSNVAIFHGWELNKLFKKRKKIVAVSEAICLPACTDEGYLVNRTEVGYQPQPIMEANVWDQKQWPKVHVCNCGALTAQRARPRTLLYFGLIWIFYSGLIRSRWQQSKRQNKITD